MRRLYLLCLLVLMTKSAVLAQSVNFSMTSADDPITPGGRVTVNVIIQPSAALSVWGIDAYIQYDPAVLGVPTLTDLRNDAAHSWQANAVNARYDTTGATWKVQYSKGTFTGPGWSVSGSQTVYQLDFPVKTGVSVGSTTLSFLSGFVTILDANLQNLPVTTNPLMLTVFQQNRPPNTPANPSPGNTQINVSITPTLSWSGGDPDGDAVTYDVYFDTFSPPTTRVSNDQAATSYTPATALIYQAAYFWKVEATDSKGNFAAGGVWRFTTQPGPSVTADFSAAPLTGVAPLQVTFTNQSMAFNTTITSWQWDFDNNGAVDATGQGPHTYTYTQIGVYTAKLTVSDAQGLSDSEIKSSYIRATPEPTVTADFLATPRNGVAPLQVTFTNQSSATNTTLTNWQWDFDNNGTTDASGIGPHAFTYAVAGTYSVKLTVSDGSRNDEELKTEYITVTPAPIVTANFTAAPLTGVAPLQVTFTDQSTATNTTLTSWQWDFDNNGTTDATGKGPHTYTYAAAGTYSVKLTASNGQTASDIELKTNYITVSPAPSVNAEFSATPLTGYAPLQVTFTDHSSGSGTSVTSWQWDFENNGVTDATGAGPHTYTYTTVGSYTVKLTVSDNAGRTDTETKFNYVIVSPTPVLTAAFTATPRSGRAPLRVTFTDQSSATNATLTNWQWDFDNNGTTDAVGKGPHAFTYATADTYTVKLIVSAGDFSDAEIKTDYIQVGPQPLLTAGFSGSPLSGVAPLQVTFTDQSTATNTTITAWQWDFDNNGTTDATGRGPHVFRYANAGVYAVKLTVSDTLGTTNTALKSGYITVSPPPPALHADFSGAPLSGRAPITVTFSDQSVAENTTITGWQWDFNNDGIADASGKGPHRFTYSAQANYTVKLTITDGPSAGSGQSPRSDVKVKPDYIAVQSPMPLTAYFTATPRNGIAPLTVVFSDASAPDSGYIEVWQWDFNGDGIADASGKGPHTYTYSAYGVYTPALTVSNAIARNTVAKTGYIVAGSDLGDVNGDGKIDVEDVIKLLDRILLR